MRRRELLAGLGGLGVLGGGAALAFDLVELTEQSGLEAVELEGIEAPGSAGTAVSVPERGGVSVVEFFATWCSVCAASMSELVAVHDRVGDDVQFVSVTNEPLGTTTSRGDVADWWSEHDGDWQVAYDGDLELTQALDATGVPYAFVLDGANDVVWRHRGRIEAGPLESAIEDARS